MSTIILVPFSSPKFISSKVYFRTVHCPDRHFPGSSKPDKFFYSIHFNNWNLTIFLFAGKFQLYLIGEDVLWFCSQNLVVSWNVLFQYLCVSVIQYSGSEITHYPPRLDIPHLTVGSWESFGPFFCYPKGRRHTIH